MNSQQTELVITTHESKWSQWWVINSKGVKALLVLPFPFAKEDVVKMVATSTLSVEPVPGTHQTIKRS